MLLRPGLWVLVAALACASLGAGAVTGESLEYPVKAAFLVNFAKFVDWPSGRFPADGRPIVIGVIGSPEMAEALRQVAGREPVRGHPLEIRAVTSPAAFDGQILYAGAGARPEEVAALGGRKGLLLVGELPPAAAGTIIRFYLMDRTVRFEVSLAQARRAGLTLSSRLLKVARVVDQEGEGH
jgi:hypothetical protein